MKNELIEFSNDYTKHPKSLFKSGGHILCDLNSLLLNAAIALGVSNSYFIHDFGELIIANQSTINLIIKISIECRKRKPDHCIALVKHFVEKLCTGIPGSKALDLAIRHSNSNKEIFRHKDYVPEWLKKVNANKLKKAQLRFNYNNGYNKNNNYYNNNNNSNRNNGKSQNNGPSKSFKTEPKTKHLDKNPIKIKPKLIATHMCQGAGCTVPGCSNTNPFFNG